MTVPAAFALIDNFAAFALASVGLPFTLIALIRISLIAWNNISQVVTRHWHLASHFARSHSLSKLKSH